jgi:hypothetical protein
VQDLVNFELTESLLEGRRYLEWLQDDCVILEDYCFLDNGKWSLKLQLKNKGTHSEFIPDFSHWYVFIDRNYPSGKIEFYPSKKNGISCVFPHQSPHQLLKENNDYYNSKLCLEQFAPSLETSLEDETCKLYYFVEKALEWIKSAANGTLLADDDYFEIVAYPNKSLSKRVLFSESELTYRTWLSYENAPVGFFNMKRGNLNSGQNNFLFITDFYEGISGYKKDNAKLVSYTWGNYILDEKTEEKKGIWVKLSKMPYVEPWEAPKNWIQLIKIFADDKLNFYKDIMPFLNNLRDQNSHILLLGFPIPKKVNGVPHEVHWQSLELPVLSDYSTHDRFFKGFRKDTSGFEMADRRRFFSKENLSIEWIDTDNWSQGNIVSRGNLSKSIKQMKFLFVGVGALGSIMAEMLVRSGVAQADIVDQDIVEIGNLTRHILTMEEVGKWKATCVERKLAKSFIHFKGQGFNLSIEKFIQINRDKLSEYDVIIETTGSDKVLEAIANEKLHCNILSVSIGLYAKRMYINNQNGRVLSLNKFRENLHVWISKDEEDFPKVEYPRDGLGCWHPLFPARVDHLSMLASSAISIIENDLLHSKEIFTVIERGDLGTISIQERKEIINES